MLPEQAKIKRQRKNPQQQFQPGRGSTILEEEIAILKSAIQRLNEILKQGVDDPPEILKVTDGIGKAAIRLATLARTQYQLSGNESDQYQQMIRRALSEVVDELGIK